MSLTTSKTVYRQSFGVDPAVVASYPYCLHCSVRKAAGGMGYDVAPCVPGVGGEYAERVCCGTPIEDLHLLLKTQSHPSETAAIIIEPILGEGGFLVPPPGYLEELRKVCDENEMLLVRVGGTERDEARELQMLFVGVAPLPIQLDLTPTRSFAHSLIRQIFDEVQSGVGRTG